MLTNDIVNRLAQQLWQKLSELTFNPFNHLLGQNLLIG
jgi:hypothetical protein